MDRLALAVVLGLPLATFMAVRRAHWYRGSQRDWVDSDCDYLTQVMTAQGARCEPITPDLLTPKPFWTDPFTVTWICLAAVLAVCFFMILWDHRRQRGQVEAGELLRPQG